MTRFGVFAQVATKAIFSFDESQKGVVTNAQVNFHNHVALPGANHVVHGAMELKVHTPADYVEAIGVGIQISMRNIFFKRSRVVASTRMRGLYELARFAKGTRIVRVGGVFTAFEDVCFSVSGRDKVIMVYALTVGVVDALFGIWVAGASQSPESATYRELLVHSIFCFPFLSQASQLFASHSP